VYCEGQDDISFWSLLFPEQFNKKHIEFVSTGGRPALEACANSINSLEELEAIVVMDGDYDVFFGIDEERKYVIKLNGYSIENYLITPEVLTSCVRTKSKKTDYSQNASQEIFDKFDDECLFLIALDLLMRKNDIELDRDLSQPAWCVNDDWDDCLFCIESINTCCKNAGVDPALIESELDSIDGYVPSMHFRGHFLLRTMRHIISKLVKKHKSGKSQLREDELFDYAIAYWSGRDMSETNMEHLQKQIATLLAE
tara:strand:+ start:569938 stop:570702 length:765 start_codon:yes stop_codon:yes gene_type:complete